MIIINASMHIDPIIYQINRRINEGMKDGAKAVAIHFQKTAQELLAARIADSGGKSTGRLASSILVKTGDAGFLGYARYDVVVDVQRAPYAAWVEYGRQAPVGLPYSKAGGKDYSRASFRGHSYLRGTLTVFKQPALTNTIIVQHILSRVLGKGQMMKALQ